ncbi:MAG: hypothetical protein LBR26_01160 [Prevotella sp.]|jgi:hypothetical protein|nr:hypothetical protein [Prevotella sp.]
MNYVLFEMGKVKDILICTLALVVFSCGKEEIRNVIPVEQVNFKLNLNSADAILRTPGNSKEYVNGKYPVLSGEYLGYGGLLVINSFYATDRPDLLVYDLSCPYEASRSILVKASTDGNAKCSQCGRIYNLMERGRVISGSSGLHLQRYSVRPTSNPDIFYITR